MADTSEVQTNAPAPSESSTPLTTPPASTPAAAGAPITEAAKPETRRDTISRVIADKNAEGGDTKLRDRLIAEGKIKPASPAKQAAAAAQTRTERGQFAGTSKATPQQPGAVQQAPAASQRPPLPKWLKKELEPIWSQAQPELLEAFNKYGEDATKGIDKWKSAAQERDALLAEFRPYDHMLRAEGATPQSVIRNLMQTAVQLRQGSVQEKAQLVARTMQQFGIPFEHIASMYGVRLTDANGNQINQPVQQQQQPDQSSAVLQRVQQLEGFIQSQHQAAQAADDRRVKNIADSFGKDRPHYEELKPQIAGILNGGLVQGAETMSEEQILTAAYDMALRLNPSLYETHLREERERAAQAERDRANQQAATSRSAAVQVRGAPGPSSLPAIDPKDRRSAIRAAIAAHSR